MATLSNQPQQIGLNIQKRLLHISFLVQLAMTMLGVSAVALVNVGLVNLAFASPITKPAAVSLYGEPLYLNASAMPYSNPNAPKGGSVVLQAIGTTFDSFNALINKGTPVEGTELLSDSLTAASLDEPFARYPLLAHSVTYDPNDASWIVYHINPAAKFSNGLQVTAHDVAFTFNTVLKDGTPSYQMYFADIKSVVALNNQDVRFNFKTQNNHEIALTVGEMPILSAQDWKNRPFNRVSMQPYLGSGPYVVKRVESGRGITYQRNPNYWAKDLPVNKGKYNFDEITYQYFRNPEISFEAFKSGQYSLREENKARNWAVNYNFPAVKAGMVVKQLIPHQKPVTMQALVFNLRRDKFKPLKVRQALDYAFDFEWMNKAIFNMGYTRLQSFFYNSELEAKGKPTAAEMQLLQPLLLRLSADEQAAVLQEWHQPTTDGSGFNRTGLLKARQLLLDSGYHYQNTKLVDAHGKAFEIDILLKGDGLQRVILPFVYNLKRLGVTANIRQVDTPQFIERARHFDYDMIVDGFPQSLSPGNEQMGYWHSSSASQQGGNNSAGIQSAVVDALLAKLVNAKDRETLITITHALDRVLRAGHFMIPMYGIPAYRVAYWNKFAMPAVRPKYDLGLHYWWIDAKKAAALQAYLGQSVTKSASKTADFLPALSPLKSQPQPQK